MKAKYLSLLALSALLVSCGPTTSAPTTSVEEPSEPTTSVVPTTDPTSDPTTLPSFNGPKSVGLIGAFEGCNWDVEVELTKVDDEGRTWTLDNFAFHKGDEFKLRANDAWDWQWGYESLDEESAVLFEETGAYGGNCKVLTSAYYSISVNAVDDIVTITKGEEIADNPFVSPESIGIIGSFADNNWASNEYELESVDGGHIWTIDDVELLADTQFKLRLNNDWAKAWGYDNFDDETKELFTRADDGNAIVVTSGYYSFLFDYDAEVVSISLDQEIIETPSFEEAVAASFEAHESVKSGTISYLEENLQYQSNNATEYSYEFGEDKNGTFVYSQEVTKWDTIEDYYIQSSNGTWYSVYLEGDSFSTNPVDGNEKFEYGTTLDILGYRFLVNGAQGLLEFVADALAEDVNGTAEFNGDVGLYQVSTSVSYVTDYTSANRVWDVTASVTFGELGNLESIVVLFEEYNNPVEDLETGAWVKGPESVNTNRTTISCEQEVGERTIENPIDIDVCFYTAWDLASAAYNDDYELEVGEQIDPSEVITINNGGNRIFKLINAEPETANPEIDEVSFEMIEGDEEGLNINFMAWSGNITVNPSVEGDYIVKVSTANVETTLKFKILPAAAESVSGYVYFKDGNSYNTVICEDGEAVEFYEGSELFIGGNTTPFAADKALAYKVISGEDVADIELVKDWKQNDNVDPKDVLKVNSKAVGTVTVKVMAAALPEVYTIVTINFKATPNVEDFLANEYVSGRPNDIQTHLVFTPSADNALVGKVSIGEKIKWDDEELTYVEYDYSYDSATKVFNLSVDGVEYTDKVLCFNALYELKWDSNTLKVLDDSFYFCGSDWTLRVEDLIDGTEIKNAMVYLEIYNSGTEGSFGFFTSNANFEQPVNVNANVEFEIVKTESGFECVFDAESLAAIEESGEISNLSIKWSADVQTVTFDFDSKTYGHLTVSGASL